MDRLLFADICLQTMGMESVYPDKIPGTNINIRYIQYNECSITQCTLPYSTVMYNNTVQLRTIL